MAFGNFKSVQEVARMFQISVQVGQFVQPLPMPVSDRLRDDLQDSRENLHIRMSEAAVCEFLIAPILKEVWKPYRDSLLFWSHVALGTEEPLIGTPDYYFSRRSALGLVPDQPYVLVVEAKKDDFDTGWAQCLAAMLAAQKMNDSPRRIIHGCVSNGTVWEFGKLEDKVFVTELRQWFVADLVALFAAWNYILTQAKQQALAPAA